VNDFFKQLVQTKVWDRLTKITEPEYHKLCSYIGAGNYTYGAIADKTGFYKYNQDTPPDFVLMDRAVAEGILDVKEMATLEEEQYDPRQHDYPQRNDLN
jgi:hypothetical protein